MNNTKLALDALLTRYVNLVKAEYNTYPSVNFEPPWPSPCTEAVEQRGEQQGEKQGEKISYWRPVERNDYRIFNELEQALELSFREDFKQFYGSFWSNGICVERDDINFNLIQIWNEEDQEQLKENILGHAFAKLKSRQPLSYFIGCTHGDDVICIEHETGEITLEKPGKKAHKTLAPTLEAFLLSLNPMLDKYNT